MDPETDIETSTRNDRPRRASRAPWDPPLRPEKPSTMRRRAAEPGVLAGDNDDLERGTD